MVNPCPFIFPAGGLSSNLELRAVTRLGILKGKEPGASHARASDYEGGSDCARLHLALGRTSFLAACSSWLV